MDLLTTPYVFDPDQARRMADAGADLLIAHMGLTTSGTVGATTAKSLLECVDEIRRIADAAKSRRSDIAVLCHGGPLAMPADAQFVLDRCPEVVGFYGASSMERLPTEVAITEQARSFASIKLTRARRNTPPRAAPVERSEGATGGPGSSLQPAEVD
jgi:predicted TIM-barrel enzyme